jgi:hypothetical protein
MEFTEKEKKIIFWSMVKSYYQFKGDRRMVEVHLHDETKAKALASIDEQEKSYYEILERLSIEIGVKIPEYVKP